MSTAVLEEKRSESAGRTPVINDFSIHVATANGSGSQSSNSILMRSIFQMGIPVSGKNLFPSNIQGLPTWFTIRASKEGFIARRRDVGVLICMNPETAHEDVRSVAPGAAVIYEENLKLDTLRNDVVFYPVPFSKLVLELVQDGKLRRLAVNMIYVGVAAWLLDVDMGEIEKAVAKQFKSKAAAVEINMTAIRGGLDWAQKNLTKRDPFRFERMNATAGKIIIEGNAAGAIGCMMAGVQFLAWYPITPSSSLAESLIDYAGKYRLDPETGQPTLSVVQAEDELAALGMVLGAGWAGARAMTTTSGPGISLMSEFTGLGYYAEVPAVIVDVQRVGPSTGLPTRTMQGDITSTYYLGHGDSRHILLLPGSVEECYSMAHGRLRPGRALPDAGVPDERPRPRDEQLDGRAPALHGPAARPRQGPADQGRARRPHREVQGVRPLPRRGRRRHPLAHAAGLHGRAGRDLLHPRLGPQRPRAVHGAARRLQEQHGPAGAQARDGARSTCPSPSSPTDPARASASSPTAPPTSPSRRRA